MVSVGKIRYIGSKARLASDIIDFVGEPHTGAFIDVMAGTGVVSRHAALRGWRVVANDYLLSSTILTTAGLLSERDVPFLAFGGYEVALKELAKAAPVEGFIFREYTPEGQSPSGHVRQYFTPENGRKIDGIRSLINNWQNQSLLTRYEHALLIADLLNAANSVANIAGTYGCFLRHWTSSALRTISLNPRTLLETHYEFTALNIDAFDLKTNLEDVAYIDLPYTKRQYAAYYHVLETIAAGDEPEVLGITGLRPWKDKLSPFCYKTRALAALEKLITGLRAHRIILSYSSEGHMKLNQMEELFGCYGEVRTHSIPSIGRYRPNQKASAAGSEVVEYLIELVRSQAMVEVA